MKFARLTSRVVAGGATAALAAAGLVGATTTSAHAVSASTDYSCTIPGNPNSTFAVAVNLPVIPATAPAGFPVPAGLLSFTSTISVPNAVGQGLGMNGVNGAKSDNFTTQFGDIAAPAPVVWSTVTPGATAADPYVFNGKGANGAFALPKAGTYPVAMPKTFTLIPTHDGAALPFTSICTSAAPATLASITLSKQASVTKVKGAKTLKSGGVESLKIKVSNDYSKTGGVLPTGKVVVKDGSKNVGKGKVVDGKATIKVKNLGVGVHNLIVKYAGDDYNVKSKGKKLEVTVTK
jgi:hypothetical protein